MWQNKYESSFRLSGQVLVADNAEHSSILQTVSLTAVPLTNNAEHSSILQTVSLTAVPLPNNAEHSIILQTVSLTAAPLPNNVIVAVGKDTCAIYRVPHESWSTCSHVTNITKIYHTL